MTGPSSTLGAEVQTSAPGARHRVAVLVGVVLTAVIFLLLGWFLGVRDAPPGTTSAEAGFSRDMQVHHDQAVLMAFLIRDRTDDEEVRSLAFDIATSQAQQSGQMHAWLVLWDVSQASPEPSMAWMVRPVPGEAGHEHETEASGGIPDDMPGYASAEDLARLEAADGVEAERIFLELMIEHHRGGVEMAEAVLLRARHPAVLTLARSIVMAQESEIALMEGMLAERAAL